MHNIDLKINSDYYIKTDKGLQFQGKLISISQNSLQFEIYLLDIEYSTRVLSFIRSEIKVLRELSKYTITKEGLNTIINKVWEVYLYGKENFYAIEFAPRNIIYIVNNPDEDIKPLKTKRVIFNLPLFTNYYDFIRYVLSVLEENEIDFKSE